MTVDEKLQAQIGGMIVGVTLCATVAGGLAWSWRWSAVIAATVWAVLMLRVVIMFNIARRREYVARMVLTPDFERDKIVCYQPNGEPVAFVVGIDRWADHEERLGRVGVSILVPEPQDSVPTG